MSGTQSTSIDTVSEMEKKTTAAELLFDAM